jgi:hypothetical protein
VLTHRQVLYQLRYSVDRDRTATLRVIEAYAGSPTACSKLPIAMQPQRWNTVGHAATESAYAGGRKASILRWAFQTLARGRQRRQQRGLTLLTGTGKTLGFALL